jgi:PKD repeat protein
LILLTLTGITFSQVSQEWVQQRSGFWAASVVVDSNGNAYVTGPSLQDANHNFKQDVITIKYDPAGNEVWVREFDETADSTNGADIPTRIILDSIGNVIVAGESYLFPEGRRFLILKYDSAGNLLWRARSTMGASVVRVATDAAGNIYATGSTLGIPDFVTVKFDPEGNQLWLRTYNGTNNFTDEATGLDVTPGGTVVVTGKSTGGISSYDFATIVYNTDGSVRWTQRYNSPSNGADQPADVVFGPNEIVYVGGFQSTSTNTDFSLVKYASDGTLLWVRTYNGPPDKGDLIKRIRLDSAGNIIVTGLEQQSNFYSDGVTIKYDPSGNQLWLRRLNLVPDSEEILWTMAIGASNEVFVAGESAGSFAVVKYNSSGTEEWNVTYDNPGNLADRVYGIALGPSNRVVVTGTYPILTASYIEGSVNQAPIAVLSADEVSGNAPLTVNFSSVGSYDPDGNLVSYLWDFGDQSSSTETNPSHIYNNAGSYNVTLKVFDNGGLSSQDTELISVNEDSTLFFENFASGDISQWQRKRGTWTVVNQTLWGQNNKKAEILSPFAGCGNCSVEADLQLQTATANASILGWYFDVHNYVEVSLMGEKGKVVLKQIKGGSTILVSKSTVSVNPGVVYRMKVVFTGTAFSVYLDGNMLFTTPTSTVPFGKFGFRVKGISAANSLVTFDNMQIQ